MFKNTSTTVNTRKFGISMLAAAAGLVGFAALPSAASAHEHGSVGVAIGVRTEVPVERVSRIWVPDTYRTVIDRVWVPAQYHVVSERIYRQPVVEDRCERVWVPDRWEVRDIVTHDRWGHRIVHHERVLAERGHYAETHRQVVVKEGCWENVDRKVIDCGGHWQNVERQELLCAGHWEDRVERIPSHREHVGFELGLGYRR
jgi:hypothetical protein